MKVCVLCFGGTPVGVYRSVKKLVKAFALASESISHTITNEILDNTDFSEKQKTEIIRCMKGLPFALNFDVRKFFSEMNADYSIKEFVMGVTTRH